MKKRNVKLNLNRETLQQLEHPEAKLAKGGVASVGGPSSDDPTAC